MLSPIRDILQFMWYGAGRNNAVCIIGILDSLEYHVVLVNRSQIRSIEDVTHWANASSLYNTCSNRQKVLSGVDDRSRSSQSSYTHYLLWEGLPVEHRGNEARFLMTKARALGPGGKMWAFASNEHNLQ